MNRAAPHNACNKIDELMYLDFGNPGGRVNLRIASHKRRRAFDKFFEPESSARSVAILHHPTLSVFIESVFACGAKDVSCRLFVLLNCYASFNYDRWRTS